MSPPHRKFPKALKNCAEVIELGKDAISYCLVRRAPRQTLAALLSGEPCGTHTQTQPCTSGRQPCPRAAVASRSFARSRRRRAERVRSGDDDVASGGGARIVHRRRGARAVLHVADAPVIELNARTQIRRPRPDAPPPAPLPHPNAELQAIQAQTILLPRSRVLLRLPEGTRAPHSTRPAPPARPTDSPFLVGSVVRPGPFICSVNITSSF